VANVFRWINGQSPLISLFARDENRNIIKNPDGSNRVHQQAGDTYSPLGITKAPTSTANFIIGKQLLGVDNRHVLVGF